MRWKPRRREWHSHCFSLVSLFANLRILYIIFQGMCTRLGGNKTYIYATHSETDDAHYGYSISAVCHVGNWLYIPSDHITQLLCVDHLICDLLCVSFTLHRGFGLTVWIPRALKWGNDIHKESILCDMIDEAHAKNITFTESPVCFRFAITRLFSFTNS